MYQAAKIVFKVMTPSQAQAPNIDQANRMSRGYNIPSIPGTRRCDRERKQPKM